MILHSFFKSIKKEWLFRAILIFIPFFLILLLEFSLRLVNYGPDLRLFVDHPDFPQYYRINPQLGLRYFPSLRVQPETSYDVLLKEKPENGFRVFVLGGSSAFGYPYGKNVAFSSFLRDRVKDFLPEKNVEVVNLAMCAVGSYSVRDIGLELFRYQPDAILIYAGHNEFYGALGVGSSEFVGKSRGFVNFYLKLRRYKTFLLMRDLIVKIRGWISPAESNRDVRLMEHMAAEKLIPENSELFRRAVEIYQGNLFDLIDKAEREKVPVFLGELVSNWRDQPPFRSVFTDSAEKSALGRANIFFEKKNIFSSQKILDSLIAQNTTAADVFFLKARCLEALGQPDSSKKWYLRAKDADALRFRAPEALNFVLRILARNNSAQLVGLKSIFAAQCRGGIIGNELMTDHLHPNVQGYFLMGKAFFEAMKNFYPWEENLKFGTIAADSIYWKNSGVTPLDVTEGDFRIQILKSGWPFGDKPASMQSIKWDPNDVVQRTAMDIIREKMTWEQAHVALADFYIKGKKFDLAVQEYRALIKATPYNVSPYLQIGRIFMHLRRFADAAQIFQQSVAVEKTVFGCQGAGEALLHLNKPEQGLSYLTLALQMDKKNPLTLYLLAKSYYRSGDVNSAKKFTAQLANVAPGFPGLRELRRILSK
ncbi:hypothetical protein B6D60_01930 [candidate division KSB1 bacterium 4484_87]|nr:MAG: hypothetical protein B6D60_01930 [candidate division KSB1 bacterium 4484_87]